MIDNPVIDVSKITLVSIKTLKGSIEEAESYKDEFSFEFATSTNVGRDLKHFRFIIDVNISMHQANKVINKAAHYSIEFIFLIDNLEDFVDIDEKGTTANVHPDLGVTVAGIAYGTIRGIIYQRTQGTALDGIILPVIDPSNLLKVKRRSVPSKSVEKAKSKTGSRKKTNNNTASK